MKRSFTWKYFPKEFIVAVLSSPKAKKKIGNKPDLDDSVEMLCPEMDRVCSYPDTQFVRDYRREIEDYFLAESNSLVKICKVFQKKNYGGIKVDNNEDMLNSLRKKKLTAPIAEAYVKELRAQGKKYSQEDDLFYSTERVIDIRRSSFDGIRMEDFQKEAVAALDEYFNKKNRSSGILMLPTGGGKTRVSTVFIAEYMLSKGYQIIWLTHRHMLIDQAADNLYKISPMVGEINEDIEELHLLCISGKHSDVRALQKHDDIIVASTRALCLNKEFIPNILQDKVMIVVDEAHHAVARSYSTVIDTIRKERPDAKLLGLTATPERTNPKEKGRLKKMFGNKIIYKKTADELIAGGFLANPNHITVYTDEDVESYCTEYDYAFMKKWGEMSDELIEKVARSSARNDSIVEQYVKNKEKYGKTLVFALNGYHCITLNDKFQKAGIRSDYVYTHNKDNDTVIEKFKSGELDVLININILTEGSDVPDIQTVFLTRPTGSEILLTQMVGRGMRGISAGGTETVNIVDFCDKWETITKWLHPADVIRGFEYEEADIPLKEPQEYIYEPVTLIPAQMIKDIANATKYVGGGIISCSYALPAGWFDIFDRDGADRKILVFDNQVKPYERMRRMQNRIGNDKTIDSRWVFDKCFTGMETAPAKEDIEDLIHFIRKAEVFPELVTFEERSQIDPYTVALRLKKEDIVLSKLSERVKAVYDGHAKLIDSIYDGFSGYKAKVMEWVVADEGIAPIGSRVEEAEMIFMPKSKEPFPKDLEDLLKVVVEEMREYLPEDFETPDIRWADNTYRRSFADYTKDLNVIRINSILNFANVPEDVIKFLIYHECLHYEVQNHGKYFREKEHKYQDFGKWDHWLDYEFPNYVEEM